LELDHVLIAVTDLAAAAEEVEARYGLVSVEGGRHSGWGTANRIVPLGAAYLELIAVVDETEAADSAFGTWVAHAGPSLPRPLGWAVRTNSIDEIAPRLGLAIVSGSRKTPGNQLLKWQLAGIEEAAAEPSLPFFIEWGKGTPLPGRTLASHPAGAVRIEKLELYGDVERLTAWLGPHRLPINVHEGEPAVARVVLAADSGEIVLDGNDA
jgi:hypothetical protein